MRTEKERQDRMDKFYALAYENANRRELSNAENYDKSLLTLSSFSIGFSILVLKYVVPWNDANSLQLLFYAWGILGVSIFSSLVSYRIAIKSIRNYSKDIRDYYLNGVEDALNRKRWYDKCVFGYLDILTGVLFMLGLILIIVFVYLNIPYPSPVSSPVSVSDGVSVMGVAWS